MVRKESSLHTSHKQSPKPHPVPYSLPSVFSGSCSSGRRLKHGQTNAPLGVRVGVERESPSPRRREGKGRPSLEGPDRGWVERRGRGHGGCTAAPLGGWVGESQQGRAGQNRPAASGAAVPRRRHHHPPTPTQLGPHRSLQGDLPWGSRPGGAASCRRTSPGGRWEGGGGGVEEEEWSGTRGGGNAGDTPGLAGMRGAPGPGWRGSVGERCAPEG